MRTKKSIAQHDLFAEESGESLGELFNVTDARAKCLEFFAGSGLASEALKTHFKTVWANDNCVKKQVVYRANHNTPFLLDTIENVRGDALPAAQLAWASFPCQDLSLAGNMGGLDAERSGMVWQWLRVIDEMPNAPSILVAENVVGLVSIEGGAHYQRLHRELVKRGYKVGALMLDAATGSAGSTLVTRLAANGEVCGLQLAGLPGRWFRAPAAPVCGPFMKGAPDNPQFPPATGDSGIIDAFGLGGQVLRRAPSLQAAFQPWLAADDDARALALLCGMHPLLGVEIGVDAAAVVATGRAPLLSTGMVSADGRGLLGRGLCELPLEPFRAAMAALTAS